MVPLNGVTIAVPTPDNLDATAGLDASVAVPAGKVSGTKEDIDAEVGREISENQIDDVSDATTNNVILKPGVKLFQYIVLCLVSP